MNRGRILLADDDGAILHVYGRVLESAGYEVEVAHDGLEAVEAYERGKFDVVVADISMPRLDGLGLLRAVRRRDSDIPFVLMTGGPTLDSALSAMEFGVIRYLSKPVTGTILLEVVNRAIALRDVTSLRRRAAELLKQDERRVAERAGLGEALDRGLAAMWMAFQPIVRWSTKEIYGYEALLRSGEPAFPHPGLFLDAAEELGRIHDVGRAVRTRSANGIALAPAVPQLFVNLHPLDLLDDQLLDCNSPLSTISSHVVLEITERRALDEVRDLGPRLEKLRGLGFKIAVDDLGAGYAGLSSFTTIEPEVVKLDMALTRSIDTNTTKRKLVGSLIEACASLGTAVVAEGIETEAELGAIVELGCDLVQGFLFAKPGRALPPVSWPTLS